VLLKGEVEGVACMKWWLIECLGDEMDTLKRLNTDIYTIVSLMHLASRIVLRLQSDASASVFALGSMRVDRQKGISGSLMKA